MMNYHIGTVQAYGVDNEAMIIVYSSDNLIMVMVESAGTAGISMIFRSASTDKRTGLVAGLPVDTSIHASYNGK